MGSKKNVDMSQSETTVKVVETPEESKEQEKKTVAKQKKQRSKKYVAARGQVDKSKAYDPFAAIELIKKLSISSFDGTIEAHAVVKKAGKSYDLQFPHSTGKTLKVAIASDAVLKKIADGNIDFDVLVASKADMPKLMKHARTLGPKDLMPNPKSGTLTEEPEAKKKELEGGKITVKTEKKAPLLHLSIGKTSMDTKKLVENLDYLMNTLKNDLVKLSVSATMSPGVRVELGS